MSELTTEEAARRLGVTPRRVVQLLNQNALSGRIVRRDWLVSEASVRQRDAVKGARGRPLTSSTSRALIDALDNQTALPLRRASLILEREAEALSRAIAHSVTVETFKTRDRSLASARMHQTGESALARIATGPGEALAGDVSAVHGYLRDTTLEDLIDEAMLVRSDDGPVHVYRFQDGLFPWNATPETLIAVDAARSPNARVRAVGVDVLETKRAQWLAKHTP